MPEERPAEPSPCYISFPYTRPISGRTIIIQRFPETLRGGINWSYTTPLAVSLGPYHHGSPLVGEVEKVKHHVMERLCFESGCSVEAVREKIRSVAGSARACYANDEKLSGVDADVFVDMMALDGCFLLQFIVSMCPEDPDSAPDALMSMAEIHTRFDIIAGHHASGEPGAALMEFRTVPAAASVDKFISVMAATFDVRSVNPFAGTATGSSSSSNDDGEHEPTHILGLFQYRQVSGSARGHHHNAGLTTLSSIFSSAMELAEIGVRLTSSKMTKFGEMSMKKGRFLHGELSLAPVFLNELTACWLINMAARARVGATQADNYAVSSYISLVALLIDREGDVKELRAKSIVHSTFSDDQALGFFKLLSSRLRIGRRYYHIFECLQEYKKERWVWIVVHKFFYKNIKVIVTVLSVIGVLAGIFKTLVSLRPQK
uniref:Uncharacterized protein n=1 Tax=Oryza glumipatula TaxID=40148 RepID=A0A0E0BHN7_9ORYZ